jgi:hypothetical protein
VEGRNIEFLRLGHQAQQCLDLTGEGEAPWLRAVVERFDPERIPRQEQRLTALVPQREGEDAIQPPQHGRALGLVQVQEHLGVRLSAKSMPLGDEFRPQPTEIIDLTVEHQHREPVFTGHGLMAQGRKVDDGQTHVPEPNTRRRV